MRKSPKFANLPPMKRYEHLVAGSMLIAVADLLTKSWAQGFLQQSLGFPPWFGLTLAQNPGLAFGLAAPNTLIVLASIIAVVYLVYLYATKTHADKALTVTAFALIIGGAFGNLYERIVHGTVTDFISLLHIPYFNLADAALTLGVLLLIVFHSNIFTKPL